MFAAELYAATAAPMGLIVLQGVTVLGTIVLSVVLVVLGAATLAQPLLRTISGPVVVLLALVSLLVSNFGGFIVGMLLGLVGGGMIFAWSPTKNPPEPAPVDEDDTQPILSVLLWVVPALTVAMVVATSAAPASAATPRDLPCLIPFLCPSPTPTPSPSLEPAPIPTLPTPTLPTPTPSEPAPVKKECAPEDYPTGDGTPVGEAAALAARILQACAKAGTPDVRTGVTTVGATPGLLKADRLTLDDLTYRGTVKLGSLTVMEFHATKLTIVGMNLHVPPGIRLAGTSDTATISGNVRLYATDLSGKALDLLPLTFTANPPPLLPQVPLPSLFFTGVTSHVALVSADSVKTALTIGVS